MKYYILFNPLAGKKTNKENIDKLSFFKKDDSKIFCDLTEIKDYGEFLSRVAPQDALVICGGDGTLNRFVNNISDFEIKSDIFYCAFGSGNDFLKDIGIEGGETPVKINDRIANLPKLFIGDKTYRFLNGAGSGIDGFCCEEVNRLKALKKKANYSLAALKGLLYAYKPLNATITVDGKEYRYKKVWLTPTMLGKYFGGGMMIAPNQDRDNPEGTLTTVVAHNLSSLKISVLFPTIFKGKHIKYNKYIDVHTGHTISVKFDAPATMQIDGETLTNVAEYTVKAVGAAIKK